MERAEEHEAGTSSYEVENWREEFRELARLAGAEMHEDAFDAVFDLCQLRVVPHATLQVCHEC